MGPTQAASPVLGSGSEPYGGPVGQALRSATARWREASSAWAAGTSRLDLVVLLTLLLLVMRPPDRPDVVTQLICLAGIVCRPLSRRPAFWFLLVGLWTVLFLPSTWPTADNHQWLVVYWALAVGIALRRPDPAPVLARNARLIIGLVFLFATLWKLGSPDFPSGAFFHLSLITDSRFETLAQLAGGLPEGASERNSVLISAWDDPSAALTAQVLQDGPRVALLAQVMAVATILLEALVAAAFLARDHWRISRAREAVLLVFVAVTYPIAPVVGFGWLLVIMGLASTRLRRPVGDAVFVGAFLAVYGFLETDQLLEQLARLVGGPTSG